MKNWCEKRTARSTEKPRRQKKKKYVTHIFFFFCRRVFAVHIAFAFFFWWQTTLTKITKKNDSAFCFVFLILFVCSSELLFVAGWSEKGGVRANKIHPNTEKNKNFWHFWQYFFSVKGSLRRRAASSRQFCLAHRNDFFVFLNLTLRKEIRERERDRGPSAVALVLSLFFSKISLFFLLHGEIQNVFWGKNNPFLFCKKTKKKMHSTLAERGVFFFPFKGVFIGMPFFASRIVGKKTKIRFR